MNSLFSHKHETWNKIRRIFEVLLYTGNFVVAIGATVLAVIWEFKRDSDGKAYLQAILAIVAFFSLTFLWERFGLLRELLNGNQGLKADIDHIKNDVNEIKGIKRLKDDLHELEVKLNVWKESLKQNIKAINESRLLEETWIKLVKLYLKQEIDGLSKKSINSTSEIYTQLVSKLTESLHEDILKIKGCKLCRLHITGMLPEEFFNGPQIEYTTLDRSPIIFCHAFEKDEYGESHYKAPDDISRLDKLQVKRCIVVRENENNAPEEFSALSTLGALKEQFELSIRQGGKKKVFQLLDDGIDAETYLKRLYIHCEDKVKQYQGISGETAKSFLRKIVSSNSYHYYAIAKTSDIQQHSNYYEDLITYFEKYFGRDIYYFCATERDGSNNQLKRYFRLGGWPEITLFGFLDRSGQNAIKPPSDKKWSEVVNWKVGIESHYRPLTRQMDIRLLDSEDAKTLVGVFSPWLKDAKELKELIK